MAWKKQIFRTNVHSRRLSGILRLYVLSLYSDLLLCLPFRRLKCQRFPTVFLGIIWVLCTFCYLSTYDDDDDDDDDDDNHVL